MSRRVERRLRRLSTRLKRARGELAVLREQRVHVEADADDAALRALVNDHGGNERAHRDARRHAENLARRERELADEIVELERLQDGLLDER